MYTHNQQQIILAGTPIEKASKAVILIHGRGASAEDIITLEQHLKLEGMAIFAPQAAQYSWYPFSFMAPVEKNQPALDSALDMIGNLVKDIEAKGIPADRIYFAGFSQGACLTLEYVSRNATRYGGVIAFTGGLIGETLALDNYSGSFAATPVFIGTGDPDAHVPVTRVQQTVEQLQKQQANVFLKIYKGRPHTISGDEIEQANKHVLA